MYDLRCESMQVKGIKKKKITFLLLMFLGKVNSAQVKINL